MEVGGASQGASQLVRSARAQHRSGAGSGARGWPGGAVPRAAHSGRRGEELGAEGIDFSAAGRRVGLDRAQRPLPPDASSGGDQRQRRGWRQAGAGEIRRDQTCTSAAAARAMGGSLSSVSTAGDRSAMPCAAPMTGGRRA